ncbi:MAG: hydroxyphenylacetyl-CoA thioesterase PaaI [Bacteroidota bacterium]
MPTSAAAQQIADQMMEKDAFSQWLGIDILEMNVGFCRAEMRVRPEMLNGFGIAHGAITFALADSVFAFASNSQGRHAVSIETSISHTKSLQAGEKITATAQEEHLAYKTGIYTVEVTNEAGEKVALFKGTVYRSSKEWETNKGMDS